MSPSSSFTSRWEARPRGRGAEGASWLPDGRDGFRMQPGEGGRSEVPSRPGAVQRRASPGRAPPKPYRGTERLAHVAARLEIEGQPGPRALEDPVARRRAARSRHSASRVLGRVAVADVVVE